MTSSPIFAHTGTREGPDGIVIYLGEIPFSRPAQESWSDFAARLYGAKIIHDGKEKTVRGVLSSGGLTFEDE